MASLEEQNFGKLEDGRPVRRFALKNANGMVVKVMTYGALVLDLSVVFMYSPFKGEVFSQQEQPPTAEGAEAQQPATTEATA